MSKETLVCQACQRSWMREQSRGRKPRFCSDCQVISESIIKPSTVVKENDYMFTPTVESVNTISIPIVKHKGKNSWICLKCNDQFQTFVSLIEDPMHLCKNSSNRYLPYELVRKKIQT